MIIQPVAATCTGVPYHWYVQAVYGDSSQRIAYGTYGIKSSLYIYDPTVNKGFSLSTIAELFPNNDWLEIGSTKDVAPQCSPAGLYYYTAWLVNGVYGETLFSSGTAGTTHTPEVRNANDPPGYTYKSYWDGTLRATKTYSYKVGNSVSQGESTWPTSSGITNQMAGHWWNLKYYWYINNVGYSWNGWNKIWVTQQSSPYWAQVIATDNWKACGPSSCPSP